MTGPPAAPRPFFSVVIPTYDRPAALARLLESLANLDYPADRYEILVVNDGGPPLEAVVAAFAGRLRLLSQANAGPGAARNLGAAAAGGEFLAFTDDDCLVTPGWLAGLATALASRPEALCGGRTVNGLPANPYAAASQALLDFLALRYRPGHLLGACFPSENLALAKAAFFDVGGFNPDLRHGEDRELSYRWAALGRPFAVAPEAVVRHHHHLDLAGFLRQHFAYGRGTGLLRRLVRGRGLAPIRLAGPGYYLELVLSGRGRGGSRSMALLILSQAAYAAGVWRELLGPGRFRP
jgi:glycosyltransferase involved in cell wall biosynthesis